MFEPRPELNHATNALCIVGRRSLTRNLFLDRRSFLNSFDYQVDPEGKYLLNILKAAAPVCGGINLEYYFSRVDNQKLGAGTKLPHNVMGLFGVANGIDGDLRPGLPSQMIEMHDPVRLLMIVEHYPEVVLRTIQQSPETYEWFKHQWVHLVVVDPETHQVFPVSGMEVSRSMNHIAKKSSCPDGYTAQYWNPVTTIFMFFHFHKVLLDGSVTSIFYFNPYSGFCDKLTNSRKKGRSYFSGCFWNGRRSLS